MKENRNAIYILSGLSVVTFICVTIIVYNRKVYSWFLHPEFITNCLFGIFASAVLAMIIAIINYFVARKMKITEYTNFSNCLALMIVPLYNVFKNGERNEDYEIKLLIDIYEYLVENYHMKSCEIHFLLPKTKIENKINEIMDMTNDLYLKLIDIKNILDKYNFGLNTLEEVDTELQSLYMYLRNYDGEEIFTNVLSKKHDELAEIAHLKYMYSGELNF